VLDFLFGYKYIGASIVLQILVIGFFIHTFLGPNGSTLLVMGETKVLMRYALISPLVNIILNIALIPTIGVIGAAIASAISLIIANGLISTHLYKSTRIHPFTKNYLKPIGVSFLIVISIYLITRNIFVIIPFWSLPVLFALFLLVYGISLLLTKSFDKEDIIMLLLIEKRLGVNLTRFKNFLRRFI
jgi:O-antigen/teichoic acid export membrane protein